MTTGRAVRRGAVLGFGALWWWAVARLLLVPEAGALEGAVAAGGWGLGLLPVHCMPEDRAEGALAAGRWRRAWRSGAVSAPEATAAARGPGDESTGGPRDRT
ncbi:MULTISPECIES: hypothetical protein [unclassified Streptomyces]|uniref:hypothetical protein n=1 Tax=unclassified Streptomyces TaxID=2593676 RepID=UPI0036FDEC84